MSKVNTTSCSNIFINKDSTLLIKNLISVQLLIELSVYMTIIFKANL